MTDTPTDRAVFYTRGAFNNSVYIRELSERFEKVKAERDALLSVLEGAEYKIDLEWLKNHGREGGYALGVEVANLTKQICSERDDLFLELVKANQEIVRLKRLTEAAEAGRDKALASEIVRPSDHCFHTWVEASDLPYFYCSKCDHPHSGDYMKGKPKDGYGTHTKDASDTPDPHIEGWNAAIEAAASEAYQRLYPKNPQDDWTEYAKHNAAAAIEVGATIRAIPCPYQPKEGGQ